MPNKNLSLGIIGALLIVAFLNFYNGAYHESHPHMVDFSDFVHAVEDNRVKSVVIRGENIKGHYSNGKLFSSHVPFQDQDLVGRLMRHKVRIRSYPPEESSPTLLQIFVAWAPMIVLGLMWFFFNCSWKNNLFCFRIGINELYMWIHNCRLFQILIN